MKFTQEIKDTWLKALRSGEYKQTRGRLYDPLVGSYCCLGVLCAVSGKPPEGFYIPDGYDHTDQLLSSGVTRSLALLNDGQTGVPGVAFPAIADYIEKNVPAVA